MTVKDNITIRIEGEGAPREAAYREEHERLFPRVEDSTTLRVACNRSDYSASAIARAVEDCDAHVLNLNVTGESEGLLPGEIVVELRINHLNGGAAARSLERYGFRVVSVGDSDGYVDETLQERVNSLLRLIE